jgi:uncharacterized protein (DUF1330 family)
VTLHPTREQLERLATADDEEPVIMVNLLRFKARADGIDAADGITGAEAYARYAAAAASHLQRVGGRILVASEPRQSVIGPEEPEWDLVVSVQYPSRSAFLTMAMDPEYLKIHGHREAALADSRLIACKPVAA